MDVYEALYTTRAMRRVKPDPIPLEVQEKILDAAIRAPSGGNTQNWRFLFVDDPAVKAAIGPIYRECLGGLWSSYYLPRVEAAAADPDAEESKANPVVRAVYLTYLTAVGSSLGFVLHGDPDTYRYIPESIKRYPGAPAVCGLLRERGFSSCEYVPVLGGLMAIHRAVKR